VTLRSAAIQFGICLSRTVPGTVLRNIRNAMGWFRLKPVLGPHFDPVASSSHRFETETATLSRVAVKRRDPRLASSSSPVEAPEPYKSISSGWMGFKPQNCRILACYSKPPARTAAFTPIHLHLPTDLRTSCPAQPFGAEAVFRECAKMAEPSINTGASALAIAHISLTDL
jgi:hypothetical protein